MRNKHILDLLFGAWRRLSDDDKVIGSRAHRFEYSVLHRDRKVAAMDHLAACSQLHVISSSKRLKALTKRDVAAEAKKAFS